MSFVHLHCHSEYSLLDGMSKVPDLCRRAAEIGQTAIAITDHGWMAAAVRLDLEAKKAGVKPIVGSEVYVCTGEDMRDNASGPGDNYHLTLLAQNAEGYRNLARLTTAAHLQGFHYKPRISKALLQNNSGGLILLSGCIQAEVNQYIIAGKEKLARALLRFYEGVFEDRFFVEVMYHGRGPDGIDIVHNRDKAGNIEIEEHEMAAWLLDYAARRGVPVVATNDAHYLVREDGDAHDTLLCMGMGAWKHKADRMHYPGEPAGLYEFYVKTEREMLRSYPQGRKRAWAEACATTQDVADMVEDAVVPSHGLVMPKFTIPRDVGFQMWRERRVLL